MSEHQTYWNQTTKAAPLAVFRIFFGVLMFASLVRFWSYGWIEKLYLEPGFHFTFYGFEWVRPMGNWTYVLFGICMLSSLLIMVGYRYRMAMIIFFLSFTYIELMDKTTYLNHYYFISLLSFLMIFLPAGSYFSMDALRGSRTGWQSATVVPAWTIDSIKVLLAIVYIYAGLAKLNSDWMLHALPLKIWLPSKFDIPFIGGMLGEAWVAYAFSWIGAFYDLLIPFLLFYRPTRKFAFLLVVIFHVLTRVLFPIGMFPYIMIVATLIFFSPEFHQTIVYRVAKWIRYPKGLLGQDARPVQIAIVPAVNKKLVLAFLFVQLLMPWRYLLYPGELFWTEQGYRFSWRVMLMEKAGYAQFKIVDGESGRWFYVDNTDFLTPFQEKQMSFQPDFILEYAHYLRDHFSKEGHQHVEVYVDCKVSLNGRLSQTFIDPEVDLAKEKESFKHKTWIAPFNDEIKGL